MFIVLYGEKVVFLHLGKSKSTIVILDKAQRAAMRDMDDNVFKPILAPLSDNDRVFLKALARCGGTVTTARLQAALGRRGPAIQPYANVSLKPGLLRLPDGESWFLPCRIWRISC